MTASAVQRAFAHLVTDATARRAFMTGDETLLAAYPLSAEELAGFQQLRTRGRRGFELFADQLSVRRAKRVAAHMPLSRALLGDQAWAEAWSAYARNAAREPYTPPEADATRFADVLAAGAIERDGLVAAVVHYEGCKAAIAAVPVVARPDTRPDLPVDFAVERTYPLIHPFWVCEPFEFDLLTAIRELKHTGILPALGAERIHVLIFRSWHSGKVATARVSPQVRSLLARCDGRHASKQLVEHFGQQMALESALVRLEHAGVLVFARSAASDDQLIHT